MKNPPTIQELRQKGYKCRVIRRRVYPVFIEKQFKIDTILLSKKERAEANYTIGPVSSFGGETILQVRTPDGQELEARQKCSPHDQFNKKLGVKICLGKLFNYHIKTTDE